MEDFTIVDPSTDLADTLEPLLDNDVTLRSRSAGTAFPTTNLYVGMQCVRTDLNQVYDLKSTGPSVWVMSMDLDETYLSQEGGDARYLQGSNNLSDLGAAATARTNLGLGSLATKSIATVAEGGTNATTVSDARTNLGLGTAAVLNVGTDADEIVQLDGDGKLPAVDGSNLTGLNAGAMTVSAKTADFTAGSTVDNTLYVTEASAGSADATLPAASAVAQGFRILVVNETDGKSCRVLRAGSDTIAGLTAVRIPARSTLTLVRTSTSTWSIANRPAVMVGHVMEWATNTLPDGGWAWVNGQTLSRTTYAGLYAVWGTTYGAGDGSTTFGVRDDRGRVKAGKDDMGGASAASRLTSGGSGVDGATLGASGGAQTHSLTSAENGPHTHSIPTTYSTGNGGTQQISQNDLQNNASGTTSSSGSGTAHQNTQPTIITNYVVKT